MIGKFETIMQEIAEASKSAEGFEEGDVCETVITPFVKDALGYKPGADYRRNSNNNLRKGVPKKVDYDISKDGKAIIVLEAKASGKKLNTKKIWEQLYDYFTKTRGVGIGILTNGEEAWFYSDLDDDNLMDDEPFFKFNFQKNNSVRDIEFLKLFHKDEFCIVKIKDEIGKREQARKVKEDIKKSLNIYIKDNIIEPSNEFINFIRKHSNIPSIENIDNQHLQNLIKPAFAEISHSSKQKATLPTSKVAPAPKAKAIPAPAPKAKVKPAPTPKPKSENKRATRHQNPTHEVQALYEKYDSAIKAIAPDITHRTKEVYFAYSRGTKTFLWLQRKSKTIRINLKLDSLADLGSFSEGCISYGYNAHWGGGNHHITIDENSDYDYVMQQIKIAYVKARN